MIQILCTTCGEMFQSEFDDDDCPFCNKNTNIKEKELICYSVGAIGKNLYEKIYSVGKNLVMKGTNKLPFIPTLDIRNGVVSKRFIIDVAIQCLEYLLNKGE